MTRLDVEVFNQNAIKLFIGLDKLLSFSKNNTITLEDGTQLSGKNVVLANGVHVVPYGKW